MRDQDPTAPLKKPWYKKWWVWLLIVFGILIVAAALSPTPAEEQSASGETTTTQGSDSTTTNAGETTTTVGQTTTTQPGTTTTTLPVVFSDGTWLIGPDIQAGIYETVDLDVGSCYWERLSGLSGGFDDIIANDNPEGKALVEIKEGDEAFASERCGDWTYPRVLDEPLTTFPDGYWIIGDQIAPGRYRNDGEGSCYWQRLSGFSGEFDDIKANDNVDGSTIVDIASGDFGFSSIRCGTWSLIDG